MDIELYIYECKVCGQMVVSLSPLTNPITCCDQEMELMEASKSDGAEEKHVPKYEVYGDSITVYVGEKPHPMTEEHHIEWIAIITDTGIHIKCLDPTGYPKASFKIGCKEKVRRVYEYCNLHGLWKN